MTEKVQVPKVCGTGRGSGEVGEGVASLTKPGILDRGHIKLLLEDKKVSHSMYKYRRACHTEGDVQYFHGIRMSRGVIKKRGSKMVPKGMKRS